MLLLVRFTRFGRFSIVTNRIGIENVRVMVESMSNGFESI
jgi:hypothetical protein